MAETGPSAKSPKMPDVLAELARESRVSVYYLRALRSGKAADAITTATLQITTFEEALAAWRDLRGGRYGPAAALILVGFCAESDYHRARLVLDEIIDSAWADTDVGMRYLDRYTEALEGHINELLAVGDGWALQEVLRLTKPGDANHDAALSGLLKLREAASSLEPA